MLEDEELRGVTAIVTKIREEIKKRIIGQSALIDALLLAVVGDGHMLIEGVPGLAKTLTVKSFAKAASLKFKRIQFTQDLLPQDVTGSLVFNMATGKFNVNRGPVFANIVLADEINRSPPKVHSGLLEAMEEKQVTIGGASYPLPSPFFLLATENPIEQDGTYPLSEAQLDRFLLKVSLDYPDRESEEAILHAADKEEVEIESIVSGEDIEFLHEARKKVLADEEIISYIVSIVRSTRDKNAPYSEFISLGASPRAGIDLLKCAASKALLSARAFVLPEDVKESAPLVLSHRIVLSYKAFVDGVKDKDIISKILETAAVP